MQIHNREDGTAGRVVLQSSLSNRLLATIRGLPPEPLKVERRTSLDPFSDHPWKVEESARRGDAVWELVYAPPRMPADPKQQARKAVRDAQAKFEQDAEDVREARRKAFADAQAAGLSLREIAQETGLHHSTVAEIARGADS